MKNNFVVTGGAGFIGCHIVRRLLSRGHGVYVLDNLKTGYIENIPRRSNFIHFDISQKSSYRKLDKLKNIKGVFHLAAQSSGENSFRDPIRDMEVNVKGTLLLLEWCLKNNISRFIEASSLMVYGDPVRVPIRVGDICRPKSFYAAGKLAVENYLELYREKGIDYTVFRIGNAYGPNQNLNNLRQGMLSIYLSYIIRKKTILVKGSLERFRDFIFIDDIVNFFIESADNKKSFNKIYNLGTGIKHTIRDVLDVMIESCGYDPKTYPIRVDSSGTPGDIFGNVAYIRELSRDFQFKPMIDLKKGINKFVSSYK